MISGGGSSHSGRRSLDAEVNLVPFIDLLSMCICFLLMTAVWIQIGSLEVKQSQGTDAAPPSGPLDLEVRFTGPKSLELAVKKNGKVAKKTLLEATSGDLLIGKLDAAIVPLLQSMAESKGATTPASLAALVASGMVTPRVGVPYGDLVSVMDILRKHQIVNLGVVPVGGR